MQTDVSLLQRVHYLNHHLHCSLTVLFPLSFVLEIRMVQQWFMLLMEQLDIPIYGRQVRLLLTLQI